MISSPTIEPITARHGVPSLRLVVDPDSLGKRIKDRRAAAKLTQEALARQLPGATSGQQVSNWERNLHIPSPANLHALAEILGDDLVDGLPSMPLSQSDRIERKLDALLEVLRPGWLDDFRREASPFEVVADQAGTAAPSAPPAPGTRSQEDAKPARGRTQPRRAGNGRA